MDGLEAEFEGQIRVQRLDAAVPENSRLLAAYGLRGHPAVVILDVDGQVQSTLFGPQNEAALREAITAVIASTPTD